MKNERNRSLLAGLRAGCLDLDIELDKWQDIDRICKLCSSGIENEVHFPFHCSMLEHIPKQFDSILKFDENIPCVEDRFEIIFRETHI